MELDIQQQEFLVHAIRDAQKYWRARRRDAEAGYNNPTFQNSPQESPEMCRDMLLSYKELEASLEPLYSEYLNS